MQANTLRGHFVGNEPSHRRHGSRGDCSYQLESQVAGNKAGDLSVAAFTSLGQPYVARRGRLVR